MNTMEKRFARPSLIVAPLALLGLILIGSLATWFLVAEPVAAKTPSSIDLLYFRARGINSGVAIEWATASELDTAGFWVKRATASSSSSPPPDSSFVLLTQFGTNGFVYGEGAVATGWQYHEIDTTAELGTGYWYMLVEVETNSNELIQERAYAVAGATPTATAQPLRTNTPQSGPVAPTSTQQSTAQPSATATATPPPNTTVTATGSPTPTPAVTQSATATAAAPVIASTATAHPTGPTATKFVFPTEGPAGSALVQASALSNQGQGDDGYPGPVETPTEAAPVDESPYPAGSTRDEVSTISPENSFGGNGGGNVQGIGNGRNGDADLPPPIDSAGDETTSGRGGRNSLLLWTGFIGALLILAGGIFGAILLFTRQRQ